MNSILMPGVELLDVLQKTDKVVELVLELEDLDVHIQIALLDLRDACKKLDARMEEIA